MNNMQRGDFVSNQSPRKQLSSARRISQLGVCLLAFGCVLSAAAEVTVFKIDDRESFSEGTLKGVRLGEFGALELARPLNTIAAIDEPYVFSAAVHPAGWVVGTGSSGKVLLVRRDGSQEEFFSTPEPQVFAVWADADGTVFAASSPAGKVYRQPPGGGEPVVHFDPEELYVWALQRRPGGGLLVATGARGRLWEVSDQGKAELLFDSGDLHLRSLAVLADGTVLAGTAGQGRLLRFANGRLSTLYDAAEPEVLALVPDREGGVWAALVASEASLVDLSNGEDDDEDDEGVTVSESQKETTGSRAAGAAGPRSRLLHLSADGRSRFLASFADQTIHALAVAADELWIGTGQDGRLYRWAGEELALEKDLPASQIVVLLADGDAVAVLSTDSASVELLGAGRQRRGTYTSTVLDADQIARFGTFFWRGSTPSGGAVELSFRSGISEQPDATWSGWSESARGSELGLADVPPGRFVQWRAELRGDGRHSPVMHAAELTYLQNNLPPRISSFEVLPPGRSWCRPTSIHKTKPTNPGAPTARVFSTP